MSTCLFKLPHDCGSDKGLQVYEGEDKRITGYCWACDTYVDDPLGNKSKKEIKELREKAKPTKSPEEIQAKMDEISELGSMDLVERRLRKETLDHFGVKIGLSEYDGKTPSFMYFPYTREGKVVKYKVKMLKTGQCWSVGLDNKVDLFGWTQALESGAKRLIITEGEADAIALTKILEIHTDERFKDYTPAVCSIPNGAGSAARDLTRLLPKIRKHFKDQDIALCFDNDQAGEDAVDAVCRVAPNLSVISVPDVVKDANEALMTGYGKAMFKSVTFNTHKPKNSRIILASSIHEAAREQAEWGLEFPWDALTQMTRGQRYGETYYWGAGEKMGKGEIVHSLIAHFLKMGIKQLLASPEESNKKSYKLTATKLTGKIFHDPKIEFDQDAYDKAGEIIGDNLMLMDLRQHIDWETLKQDLYYVAGEGVKVAYIDPITNLTSGLNASETNAVLSGVAPELAAIAKDLDMAIHIFCHLNKPEAGQWDRGKKVTTNYFAGSSAMARSCNYAIGIQGNKDPELDERERNIREIVMLADREFGESGSFKLYWDNRTTLFNEMKGA